MNLARGIDDEVEDDDTVINTEQLKLDAKNVIMTIFLVLVIFAIPQFESSRKSDIIYFFGEFLRVLTPIADCGLIGIIFYSSLVSFWDGLSVLNVRYVEFLVALSFNTIQEYVLVMIIGKTLGGFITYRMSQKLIKNEDFEDIILNHSCSFYVHAVSDLITEMPIFYGLIIRMFFPSVLSCIALALLPLNETQFVLIQFLHASILSWP